MHLLELSLSTQRFTPCFTITEEDIEKVIVPVLDDVLASNM